MRNEARNRHVHERLVPLCCRFCLGIFAYVSSRTRPLDVAASPASVSAPPPQTAVRGQHLLCVSYNTFLQLVNVTQ